MLFFSSHERKQQTLGGSIAQTLAYLLPDPAAPGLIPNVPQKISEEKIVNHERCSGESGQWLENVDRSHLVLLASGKQVQQKLVTFS